MKSVLSVLLIASLIGIAALGALSVHAGMQRHKGACALAVAQGTDCPQLANFLDYASFHANALKNFSLATLASFFALALVAVLWVLAQDAFQLPRLRYVRSTTYADAERTLSTYAFIHWIALHEHSPSILF